MWVLELSSPGFVTSVVSSAISLVPALCFIEDPNSCRLCLCSSRGWAQLERGEQQIEGRTREPLSSSTQDKAWEWGWLHNGGTYYMFRNQASKRLSVNSMWILSMQLVIKIKTDRSELDDIDYKPSYSGGCGRKIVSSRPAWATECISDQPGQLSETLSQNKCFPSMC